MSNLARVVQGWADDLARVVTASEMEDRINKIAGKMCLDLYQNYLDGLVSKDEFHELAKTVRSRAETEFDREFMDGKMSLVREEVL